MQLKKTGIAYLLTNADYAARVVVAIDSLRHWYDGPVVLFTTGAAARAFGQHFAHDTRLRIQHLEIPSKRHGKHSAYLTKTELLDHSPFDATVFLDADTLVVGDPSELLDTAAHTTLIVTCHSNWQTTDNHRKKLILKWRDIPGPRDLRRRVRRLIDNATTVALPAINTGVFAISNRASILPKWQELARAGENFPIPDEIALQLLLTNYDFHMFGSEYNASPAAPPNDVKIWHFLAQSHLSDLAARKTWLPAYQSCLDRNVASISDWSRIRLAAS